MLSKRLSAIAEMISPGNRLADVGCDHGYIPIEMIKAGKIPSAIAMDVNAGPLERARENIEAFQTAQYIETRLSDGLAALRPGEVDTVVIAGMGGNLIMRILDNDRDVLALVKELIVQPQSEIPGVRHYLEEHGFFISAEDMVYEDGKYYTVMKAVHGSQNYKEPLFYSYGKYELVGKHPVLQAFLQKRQETLKKIETRISSEGAEASRERIKEIRQEMREVASALAYYDGEKDN